MELSDGYVSQEHQELLQSASESADQLCVSPLEISTSPKSKSPKSPRSPKGHLVKQLSGKGSPLKHGKHSHAVRDGGPQKGGSGGKGTWGGILDVEDDYDLDPDDPNYNSNEEHEQPGARTSNTELDEYKRKVTVLVEEYFVNDDVSSTANELRELGKPGYNYYFVKKLVSMAMDRHDKEKEMAAVLLSSLYADVLAPSQVYKGFCKLVQSTDDLIVDIPDVVGVLALFIARAIFDDILPPVFLKNGTACLSKNSHGHDVIKTADKSYLSAPLHAEIIERRWGGNRNKTAENVKGEINNLLKEYVVSGDKKEAFRCIKDLNMPFFHHEIVKGAIGMAMEKWTAEDKLLDFLKAASEEGLINSSQMSKGFGRVIDNVDDLSLDIPNARSILQSLISKAASEGWLCPSTLKALPSNSDQQSLKNSDAKAFKMKAQSIIQEYFLSGDISEAIRCLKLENRSSFSELNAIFVKNLVILAMERKNREKEMASVLLSSSCFPTDDVVNGFARLIESADDIALDIPALHEDLAMFLARAMVDEALAPSDLEEVGNQFPEPDSVGSKVLQMTKSLLKPRLSGERILRCWGGNGCAIEDVKDKIVKLLEEFESGGDIREACRCVKDLGMPFFYHEIIKKSLVMIMEKKNNRLWDLLRECFGIGLIPTSQMTKGFGRVAESLDDLALDVPDAKKQFARYVLLAKEEGWLENSFPT